MKINYSKINETLLIRLYGEIDHHYTEEMRDKIDRAFASSNCKNIAFDFASVDFMDSSGIGMIIGRFKLCKEKNGQAFALGLKDNAKVVFDMSGLNKIITCLKTEDDLAFAL